VVVVASHAGVMSLGDRRAPPPGGEPWGRRAPHASATVASTLALPLGSPRTNAVLWSGSGRALPRLAFLLQGAALAVRPGRRAGATASDEPPAPPGSPRGRPRAAMGHARPPTRPPRWSGPARERAPGQGGAGQEEGRAPGARGRQAGVPGARGHRCRRPAPRQGGIQDHAAAPEGTASWSAAPRVGPLPTPIEPALPGPSEGGSHQGPGGAVLGPGEPGRTLSPPWLKLSSGGVCNKSRPEQ